VPKKFSMFSSRWLNTKKPGFRNCLSELQMLDCGRSFPDDKVSNPVAKAEHDRFKAQFKIKSKLCLLICLLMLLHSESDNFWRFQVLGTEFPVIRAFGFNVSGVLMNIRSLFKNFEIICPILLNLQFGINLNKSNVMFPARCRDRKV
jgi:hypothetical protein